MAQLRDLEGEQSKMDAGTYAARREALLDEAAAVVRELDEGPAPLDETEQAVAAPNRHLKWYGLGLLTFFLLAGFALTSALAPRGDGSMTGNLQSADPVAQAEAAFEENPDDIDACNTLTKTAIHLGDMQTAMKRHDQCALLDADHPVVAAHTAALHIVIGRFEDAGNFLAPHLAKEDPPMEVILWQGIVDINTDKVDEGLARLKKVGDESTDPLDAEFARFVYADVTSVGSAPTASNPQASGCAGPWIIVVAGKAMADVYADEPACLAGLADASTALDPSIRDEMMAMSSCVCASEPAEAPKSTALLTGTVNGDIEPGGVLYVYVKNAGVDGGPPMGALRVDDWTLPLSFEMGIGNLLPFAGGQWPEPAFVKVKVARSGDPKVPSEGDVESAWFGPLVPGEPVTLDL